MNVGRPFFRLWLPLYAYMALIWVVSSVPGNEFPDLFRISGWSLLGHCVEFAIFGALLARALWSIETLRNGLFLGCIVLAAALVWGIIDEIHQLFVPMRYADPWDVVADGVGGVVGAVVYLRQKKIR